ncbi:N-acetylglucosaminyl-diphospho-decaprenol L-rhamnosyltransferase [Paenibacillus sp. CECT 9249]|uniref:glycosyltransferase family 2 protein n=1 Tax=Paenibacillus sp. CECT 9249 TaxID=2845385 RepID=UPI001E6534F6|nr:glycosyltransferase family 2 protein [Paenibacillus sp. CECT 9249]CAH0121702.1 N-acetylglucosaminyl-diphospho-decaprenol L-rhamnosyltransferase [Paenibacillus sp. CECT 9249]
MDVSILIVSYNTCKLTLDCLQSVYASETQYSYEVIVIDNDSKDDSVRQIEQCYPQARLIRNEENTGFAKANNQGMEIAQGRYVLLLNSDTVIQPDTLEIMLSFMDSRPDVGASGCKVILPDGSLDKACKRGFPTPSASFYYAFGFSKLFPNNPRFNQYQLGYLSPDEEYEIDCLVGAFMLVRKETIDEVGMLDETFFMYAEDTDWCYRIKQAGWKNYYYPRTTIMHYKRASSRNEPLRITYEFHRSMVIFYNKHYKQKYPFWVSWCIYAGIAVQFALAIIKSKLLSR